MMQTAIGRIRWAVGVGLLGGLVLSACASRNSVSARSSSARSGSTAGATSAPVWPPRKAQEKTEATAERPMDGAFKKIADEFLEAYLAMEPVEATAAGDHRFDGAWPDRTEAGDEKWRKLIGSFRSKLEAIDVAGLRPENRIDASILQHHLARRAFELDEVRPQVTDPVTYTSLLGSGLEPLAQRHFQSPRERAAHLVARLRTVGSVVQAAKARLSNPPKIMTETAIEQNRGLMAWLESGFPELAGEVPDSAAQLEGAAREAAAILGEFQTFLTKELLPKSKGDFRLGKARFEKKLYFELQDEVSADLLAKEARQQIAETQEAMVRTAQELWPSLMDKPLAPVVSTADKHNLIRKVLARMAEDRPTNETIVGEASRMVEETTQFVRDRKLVGVPTEPCRVIEMPEYRRGVTLAYCDSSGPLEARQETFYAIAPTPREWPPRRVESFFREYNRSMLAELTIHEAMPGHYLQAMHANRFRSPIRAVFSNGSFVEGWAVYAEWLMAKYGYGGPKVRLMQQKMTLRLAANALLDHDVHAGQMDENSALALMIGEAFQEEGEAVAKWKRVRLTSGQLSTYFHGYREMLRLREKAEKTPGFEEQLYHDALLSHGAPAFSHLRTLLEL